MWIALGLTSDAPVAAPVRKLLAPAERPLAFLVLAGGAWNAFWHALRHLDAFWGQAAGVSGLFMIASAWLLLSSKRLPPAARTAKPVIWLGLLACALLYSGAILQLNLA